MPSHSETFGLVYLEALSQGLPVLCSENQGIDGLFQNKVGEFVDPKSVESIASGLQRIIGDYSSFDLGIIDFAAFNWESISQTYLNIYKDVCNV